MKAKHFIPLAMLTALSLSSCGAKRYLGSYSFQMGRDKGVHLNATMQLTNNAPANLVDEDPDAKEFRFTVDIKTGSDGEEEEIPYQSIIEFAYNLFGDGSAITGYYSIGDVFEQERKHLTLGFGIGSQTVRDIAGIIAGEEAIEGMDFPDFSPDMTENLMFACIDTKAVYLTIPVSLNDLIYQLYWYGYDFYADEAGVHFDVLDEASHHMHGTHPTAEYIEALNADETFKTRHQNEEYELLNNYPYRDFHTLTVSLLKD